VIKRTVKGALRRMGYQISRTALGTSASHPPSGPAAREPKVPHGHYYSPYPDLHKIESREGIIFDRNRTVLDIDLNEDHQLQLLSALFEMAKDVDIAVEQTENRRYYSSNNWYAELDGLVLHFMIRTLRPKRILEVGSGFSSAMTLDTNERFFHNSIECTFIEPHPEDRLTALLRADDNARVIVENLESVDVGIFDTLKAGDFLMIDSSHVSKCDSDVNHIFFEILPRLSSGVHIHFHDIFYPFEYPRDWIFEMLSWTECYMLRAFLMNNKDYKIDFFWHMMLTKHGTLIKEQLKGYLRNEGGSNIWIQKLGMPAS
jgi:predicted O-methyltransferase YrrM